MVVNRRGVCVINPLPALLPGRRTLRYLGDRSAGTPFAYIRGQHLNRRCQGRHHTHEEGEQAMKVKAPVKARVSNSQ
jgi:hypothetical protein